MKILENRLKETMERLSPRRDIVTSAKIKADAEAEYKMPLPKRRIGVPAAICALVLVCGITVSAANFGWGHRLFGNTAALVESSMDDYKLEVGNVQIENAEGVPYNFTVGDVISDGYSLYINLTIDNIEVEDPDLLDLNDIHDNQFTFFTADPFRADSMKGKGYEHRTRDSLWEILDVSDNTVNTAIITRFGKKIEKGDVFQYDLRDDSKRIDLTNHIDPAEDARALLASLSFEVTSDVKDLKKSIGVNQTAVFKDRWPYSPDWGGEAPDEDTLKTVEMYVETVGISPFGIEIKGTMDSSQPTDTNAYGSWGNIWLIYKNGDRVSVEPNGALTEDKGDYREASCYGYFTSKRDGVTKMDVIDINGIEAIDICGVTVPVNPVSETEE
ncbi:MAG: hypothetical protein NC253_14345 [Ruminococcus sp.]|nr:hypothetical protein [Ruminococcus sp.]MCM1480678.1 hypothetical protein [Muribaculaceae bacterium]